MQKGLFPHKKLLDHQNLMALFEYNRILQCIPCKMNPPINILYQGKKHKINKKNKEKLLLLNTSGLT
jgi:hypothetical protein